ncbi:hypothetical protein VTP01DRAFT_8867 [Rhizomucor pusillus]|uniref:uncharacterized protein n=1 Tax=Rhizomucor pusillus TaxID=4840 RepID=UPI0037441B59
MLPFEGSWHVEWSHVVVYALKVIWDTHWRLIFDSPPQITSTTVNVSTAVTAGKFRFSVTGYPAVRENDSPAPIFTIIVCSSEASLMLGVSSWL